MTVITAKAGIHLFSRGVDRSVLFKSDSAKDSLSRPRFVESLVRQYPEKNSFRDPIFFPKFT